ncbi:MAG: hypothetical protein R3B53_02360 [Candidatus Paceibacterota bacterium]
MGKKINNDHLYITPNITRLGSEAVGAVEKIIVKTGSSVETYMSPVRESILKRYPTLFTLVVTLGATATFLGLEGIFLRFEIFVKYPELLFLLGVAILVLTGRVYKKLG